MPKGIYKRTEENNNAHKVPKSEQGRKNIRAK